MLLLLVGGPLLSGEQRLWLPSGGPLSGVGLPEAAGNQGHSPGHLVLFRVGLLEPSFHGLDLRAGMPWVAPEEECGGGTWCWHVAPALDWGFPEEQWLGLQGEVILSGD